MYWGAWIGSQLTGTQPPWDMNAVTKFAGLAGKGLSLLNWGSPFYSASNCNGYCGFVATNFDRVRNSGAIPFFSWASNPGTGAFTDAQIAAGSQDSYITAWATAAKNWGHPLFLRFDWEMNGSWMTWGVGANGNTSADFVAMWRHVHDRFAAVGATNVTWVWCPNIDQYNKLTPLSQVYPGSPYVDWTCIDGYNWGTDPAGHASGWQTFDQVFHSTYHNIVDTLAPTKPLIIGEVGSTEYGGSKAAWITDMLTVQLPQNFTKVGGVLWFEKTGGEADGMDWAVESSSTAPPAFANGVAGSSYKANGYASLGGSVIAAP
jgi:beta-mannanase